MFEFLEKTQRQMQNSEDGAQSQIEQLNEAIDDCASGEILMGEYYFSMLVLADTPEICTINRNEIAAAIEELGFCCCESRSRNNCPIPGATPDKLEISLTQLCLNKPQFRWPYVFP
ncbi:VirB4 family type IV secretion/conjugal transfer ATPase [Iodobacter fluviatilis]|uniref:CagE TrbE VirB component of type IV transporter system central domain-containing protein n=1 Tax=Iodobacter fluviatilis TaxID=537 RepID=A0A7G3GEF0_9NEIS|nr:hypothetical protein [Iodobacter fluviatilis]QBC45837.1 hypothetical protein C1H71_20045 [Iodobacter fluviatilis]